MRSLFLKIFLWFALAMVLVNVGSFVTGVLTERRSQGLRSNPVAPVIGLYAEAAVETLERDGPAALTSYLERTEHTTSIHAVIFNQKGEELSGSAIPPGAQELAARVDDSKPFAFDFRQPGAVAGQEQHSPLAAQLVRSSSGRLYTIVAKLPPPGFRPPPRLGEPGSFRFGLRMVAQRLLPVLLIGGIFCYWLARYLTKPIVELRDTTQELANGDLTARVDHSLLDRRDELGYLGRDFNLMAGRIESLVGAQHRLLGDISHELRSPLARQGVALGLARRRGGPEVSQALERIGREAQRINQMISQLLMLSRIEIGTDGLENVRVDLRSLVREVVEDADFEARGRNRSVRVVSAEDCITTGVVELLSSAIENVVRNAVRYTAEGTEVEIVIKCQQVGAGKVAVITVRDHGPGVREESIDDIFRPFYRVEQARDRKTGGTGLGLAIAARAVQSHGGTIKAANATEGGLIVEIKLPIRDARKGTRLFNSSTQAISLQA